MPVIKSPRPTAVDQSPTNPDRKPHPGQKAHLDNLPQPSQLHRASRGIRINLALLQRDISRPILFRVRSPFSGVLRVWVEVEQVLRSVVILRLAARVRVTRTYAGERDSGESDVSSEFEDDLESVKCLDCAVSCAGCQRVGMPKAPRKSAPLALQLPRLARG